jgi:hypothetical protein
MIREGHPMMRSVGFLVVAPLLAACSGSNRIEGVVPGWANTPPPTVWAATPPTTAQPVTASATPQVAASRTGKKRPEPAAKPDARPQEAKQPEPPSLPEE